jgi:hypothetical protein
MSKDWDEIILKGLGVEEKMISGTTPYSSMGAQMTALLWNPPPLEKFVRDRLAGEMLKHRGKKRLRKKRAKRELRLRWLLLSLAYPISRRVGYSEIGRHLVSVQPLPPVLDYGFWGGEDSPASLICGEE